MANYLVALFGRAKIRTGNIVSTYTVSNAIFTSSCIKLCESVFILEGCLDLVVLADQWLS